MDRKNTLRLVHSAEEAPPPEKQKALELFEHMRRLLNPVSEPGIIDGRRADIARAPARPLPGSDKLVASSMVILSDIAPTANPDDEYLDIVPDSDENYPDIVPGSAYLSLQIVDDQQQAAGPEYRVFPVSSQPVRIMINRRYVPVTAEHTPETWADFSRAVDALAGPVES